jgi:hypothetical protein
MKREKEKNQKRRNHPAKCLKTEQNDNLKNGSKNS